MVIRIQIRRDTAVNWTTNNPVLYTGEPGLETDTGRLKYGNGTSSWNELVYSFGTPGATGASGFTGATGFNGATGFKGATGFDGATGFNGATGFKGATGFDGATGLPGTTTADYPPINNTSIGAFVLATDATGNATTPGTSTTNTLYRVGRLAPAPPADARYTLVNASGVTLSALTIGNATLVPYFEGLYIRFNDTSTTGTWLSLGLIGGCWYNTSDRINFNVNSQIDLVYLWVRIA